jgi:DNA-directed RNA polymerase specialized sigma24 family protein
MLIEEPGILESLRQIVNRSTHHHDLQQDLLQECLLQLWKIESEKPGRTRSWYLQNCRFHVQHWLAAGRSLDSHRRAIDGKRITLEGNDEEEILSQHHTAGELFERVSAHDLVSTLASQLRPCEQAVLLGLAEGLSLREIAYHFGLSYPTTLKYRRRVAALATRLGIAPPILSPGGEPLSRTH